MSLTLNAIAKNPELYRYPIDTLQERMTLRPLETTDENKLIQLIDGLSQKTRQFYSYTDPAERIAGELCDAINKYDKLRFVLEKDGNKELIGLFEFSFSIPLGDKERYKKYNIKLSEADCRIGPILKDEYQSKGIGTLVLPILISIAREFNKNRIILWGGVQQDNHKAINFYGKNGFKNVGPFVNKDKIACYDMILEIK
jgi:RimJ/RimL family protein N-acetyltransferase